MTNFATYTEHHKDDPEGHISLDNQRACTITLTGSAAMSQDELNSWGETIACFLNRGRTGYSLPRKEYSKSAI